MIVNPSPYNWRKERPITHSLRSSAPLPWPIDRSQYGSTCGRSLRRRRQSLPHSGTYGLVQIGQGIPVQLAGLWDLDRIGDADSHTTDLD